MAAVDFWIARVKACPPEDLERLLFAWIDDFEDDAPEFWLEHLDLVQPQIGVTNVVKFESVMRRWVR